MQDTLFNHPESGRTPFSFNQEVAQVFDDMAERSIPDYHSLMALQGRLISKCLGSFEQAHILDLGCSTGQTIAYLGSTLMPLGGTVKFTGVDNSPSMIQQAHAKLSARVLPPYNLECKDLEQMELPKSNVVIMNYTMQFIPLEARKALLEKIYNSLLPGGVFLMAEKIQSSHSIFDKILTEIYYDFKKSNGYSELEIAQKREALDNVLIPLTEKEQLSAISQLPFEAVELVQRWANFGLYMAIKK